METFLVCVASNVALAGALAVVAFSLTKVWRSPQLAHALWLLVLIKLLAPPVFPMSVHNAWSSARRVVTAGWYEVEENPRGGVVADDAHVPMRSSQNLPLRGSEPVNEGADRLATPDETEPWPTSTVPSPSITVRSRVARFLTSEWRASLCSVWAVGALLYVALLARRLGRFRALVAEAVEAEGALVEDVRDFSKRLGLRMCPPIRVIDAHIPPLVCTAWRKPFLLLPHRLLGTLDREQMQAVLVHELAHIRRRDYLVRWFEILVRGVFWWNPLVWWASRQLRQAEEECCDAWVLWALPEGQRSYGRALLRTVEFLADRRVIPAVAGTALGGSHVKRRIEMIVKRKLNRSMSWGALLVAIVFALCVLPVVAQKPRDANAGDRELAGNEPTGDAATQSPKVAESRDLNARIERLERLVGELTKKVNDSAANSGNDGQSHRSTTSLSQHIIAVARFPSETPEHKQLRETLLARDKQAWDAAANRDWKAYEKLLRTGYYWGYFGSGRDSKAANVAALQRRRYFDVNIRAVEVGKIAEGVAFLTYTYDCKVEEAGVVQTCRDHRSMQIWTQIEGDWVITFTQDSILTGGE